MKKNRPLTLDTIVKQKEGYIVSDMGSEKVMFSMESGKYYNLGEIGGDIWELIKEPVSIRELVSILVEHFHVTHPKCESHVLSFLQQLDENGLIEVLENRVVK